MALIQDSLVYWLQGRLISLDIGDDPLGPRKARFPVPMSPKMLIRVSQAATDGVLALFLREVVVGVAIVLGKTPGMPDP